MSRSLTSKYCIAIVKSRKHKCRYKLGCDITNELSTNADRAKTTQMEEKCLGHTRDMFAHWQFLSNSTPRFWTKLEGLIALRLAVMSCCLVKGAEAVKWSQTIAVQSYLHLTETSLQYTSQQHQRHNTPTTADHYSCTTWSPTVIGPKPEVIKE